MEGVVHWFGLEGKRDRHFALTTIGEARSQHAHHRVRLAIDCYGGAEYVGISAAPHPVFVGENYDMVLARLPFLRQKVAPQREWVSQHAIQPRSVEATFDVFGLVMSGNVEVTAHPSMHVLECGGLALPVGEVSSGNFVALPTDIRPHDDQLFGLLAGGKQRGVIDSENRGSSADTER